MIALVNLLNRLSESVKLVNEIGPSVEKTMEKFTSEPSIQEFSLLERARLMVGRIRSFSVL